VAYGILQSWKGAIAVTSEVGRGTTFTLYIPAATDGATAVASPELSSRDNAALRQGCACRLGLNDELLFSSQPA